MLLYDYNQKTYNKNKDPQLRNLIQNVIKILINGIKHMSAFCQKIVFIFFRMCVNAICLQAYDLKHTSKHNLQFCVIFSFIWMIISIYYICILTNFFLFFYATLPFTKLII